MHELRSALQAGKRPSEEVLVRKEKCRRNDEPSLMALKIARDERRATNQRREDRFRGVAERATIVFRRKKSLVKVVNISGGGVMIETGLVPRIGERIAIEFDGFDRVDGAVCWVKDGRIGIDLGDGAVELG